MGAPELLKMFAIRATSAKVATELLSDPVCEWLTGSGGNFHYEISQDRVLAYGWRRYVAGTGPLRAALGLAEQLSR